jgi:outer membrane biosynthesis protein TonB
METWRPESETSTEPNVLSVGSLVSALAIHIAIFVGFAIYAVANGLFEKKEEIIPIDLSVVVVENLDGNDEEPPPLKKEQPPPPPPKPKSPPKPQPPKVEKEKALEKIVTNIVKNVEKKKDDDKKLPPQKTKEQLREERMKKMRESAKTVNKTTVIVQTSRPQPNGRTDKKTLSAAEIEKRLNEGYKPGRSTNIAASVEQFAYSLIKQTFEAKWDPPPWTDTLKPMVIRVWFGSGGRIIDSRIEKSSGDIRADQSLKVVASRVRAIPSLPEEFIKKYGRKGVPLSFTVKPN